MITKLYEPFNYVLHGSFDVSKIAEHVRQYADEWFLDTSRQTTSPVHKETNSVFVYDHKTNWSIYDSYELIVNESQKEMQELIRPIVEYLEAHHGGKVGKCLFIKLPAHKSVGEHTDKQDYLNATRRHHIAIETNPDVLFFVNKEPKNMAVGECWEINNSKLHAVENNGDTERIHLLIDIMPNKFIDKSFLKPQEMEKQ